MRPTPKRAGFFNFAQCDVLHKCLTVNIVMKINLRDINSKIYVTEVTKVTQNELRPKSWTQSQMQWEKRVIL